MADTTQPHKLEKIVVTPSRLAAASAGTSRSVTILDDSSYRDSTYNAIPDYIGELGGIDIRRRGPQGVQADVSIRGTTFEQNIVLIDGIRINDPQTGHFTMDVPLTMMDVDRIEILKGPASSLYGANAFGGVINVVTKTPADRRILVYAEGGAFDYFDGGVSISTPLGIAKNTFSFEQSRSTGYMPQTDFNILSLTNKTLIETGIGAYNFLFGYLNKDFGADSFYSNLFSNEYERTDTRFFKLDGTAEMGAVKVEPKLYLRRHGDKFVLDQNRTGWQTNYSTTYDYGGEVNCAVANALADFSCGYALSADTIDSTNLQTHSRTSDGFFAELSPHLADGLYLDAGVREDYFTGFGWQCSPSVSGSYRLYKGFSVRGMIGRAYRIPTFTDLYYNDAANKGSSSLSPESAWSYEAGADFALEALTSSVTLFRRDTDNTIDWIRYSPKNPWQAANIGTAETNGMELSLSIVPEKAWSALPHWQPLKKVSVQYTMLDTYAKHDYLSKYALDYLKQDLCGVAETELGGFKNSWVLNYRKRLGDSGVVIIDTKISKEIVKKGGAVFEAYLEASNLFDAHYSEQSDIPMPGRWVKSGGRLTF